MMTKANKAAFVIFTAETFENNFFIKIPFSLLIDCRLLKS